MVVTITAPTISLAQLEALAQKVKSEFEEKYDLVQDVVAQYAVSTHAVKNVAQQVVTAGALMSTVAFAKPVDAQVGEQIQALADETKNSNLAMASAEERQTVLEKMKGFVKGPAGHLGQEDELYLEQQLSDMLGFEVSAELDNHRLNHSIGIMGGEQHLKRFPTDTISQHDAYQESGIAPNRGAFGWFTENGQLTPEAVLKEKYYFAVQTLYLPTWNSDHAQLKPWYKFRKMIMINPAEEVAVVGVVGDAGPAQWVQKQFGGSPEVIREGKVWSAKSRGHIILLFVDDPENKVPLGPISLQAAQALAQK